MFVAKFEESDNMSNVKVMYKELYAVLEANKNKKVSTILPQLAEMMSKQTTAMESTLRYNDKNELTHIYCYYHKEWEAIVECEYGKKKNTKSGYNTMCKLGVSNWTKQQRAKKKAEGELLAKLSSGEITVEELPALQAEIAEAAKVIVPRAIDLTDELLAE